MNASFHKIFPNNYFSKIEFITRQLPTTAVLKKDSASEFTCFSHKN